MSLVMSIFSKIVSLFFENSGIIFNICILGVLIFIILDSVEENAKRKKYRAKSYGTKKNNQSNYIRNRF